MSVRRLAGWLNVGWPVFYAFTVVAAVPGLLLLWACRGTLQEMEHSGEFMKRSLWPQGYRWTVRLFAAGCTLLALWLLTLALRAADIWHSATLPTHLFKAGMALALLAVLLGVMLDWLALSKTASNRALTLRYLPDGDKSLKNSPRRILSDSILTRNRNIKLTILSNI